MVKDWASAGPNQSGSPEAQHGHQAEIDGRGHGWMCGSWQGSEGPPGRSIPLWDLELDRLCDSCVVWLHPKYLYSAYISTIWVPLSGFPGRGSTGLSVPSGRYGPRSTKGKTIPGGVTGLRLGPRLCCCQYSGVWEGERPEGQGPAGVSQCPSPGASPGWPGSK